MSRANDIKLAKWLIKQGYADKSTIESWLNAKFKAEKAGKKVPAFLNLLLKKGVIDTDQLEEIKASYQNSESPAKPKKKAAPPPAAEPEEPEAEAQEEAEAEEEEKPKADKKKAPPPSGETRACPECNSSLPVELEDCNVCGAVIPSDAWIQCAFCGKSQPADQKHCDHCGCHPHSGDPGPNTAKCQSCSVQLLPDTAVCLSCGTEQTKAIKAKSSLGPVPAILLVMVLLVFSVPAVLISFQQADALLELQNSTSKPQEFYGTDTFASVEPMNLPDTTIENNEADPKSKLILAVMPKVKKSDYQDAIKMIESQLEQADTLTLSLLGLCYYKSGDFENLVALEKARPDLSELQRLARMARYQEAHKLMIEGDSATAYATIKPVLLADSKDAQVNFWGGMMAYREYQLEDADTWFVKSTRLQPKEDLGHFMLYKIYKSEDPKRANKEKAEFSKNKAKAELYKDLLK